MLKYNQWNKFCSLNFLIKNNITMTTKTIVNLSLVFLLSIGFLGATIAQSPTLTPLPSGTTLPTNSTKSNTVETNETKSNTVDKRQARSNANLGRMNSKSQAAAAAGRERGTFKTVYGYLYQDREGTVILDRGEGQTPVLRRDTKNRTPYKSIMGALNFLSQENSWRVMHNYDTTASNPRPAFLLIKQEKQE